ncbi:MAG: cytochrome c oxidase subunit 3 [Bacteroidota bacterium]
MEETLEVFPDKQHVAEKEEHPGHIHKDPFGAKIGMWIFLLTELLLFGGMFVIYGMYRYMNSDAFHVAAEELNTTIGTINTLVLLTSSLTVAMSITAVRLGHKKFAVFLLSSTIFFAVVFLINKYFEWSEKFHHGIFPGSEELLKRSNGEILFFGLYYVMTGIHGLHIIIGIVILSVMLILVIRNKITSDDYIKLENSGLYWHLVDIIWIFLFPLFYLLR